MDTDTKDKLERITEAARQAYREGFAAGSGGNVSIRCRDYIYISPSGICLGKLRPEDMIPLDTERKETEHGRPSKEAGMHLACYRIRPDIQCILHLHSPYSTAVACRKKAMSGEAMAGEAMVEEVMAGEAMAEEIMAGESMAEEVMAGEAMAEEAMAGEAMAEEAMSAKMETDTEAGTNADVQAGMEAGAEMGINAGMPAYTPGYAMRVGMIPVIPYYRPGSRQLAGAVAEVIGSRDSLLLANHGMVAAGKSPEAVLAMAEEIEENARLAMILGDRGSALSLRRTMELYKAGGNR